MTKDNPNILGDNISLHIETCTDKNCSDKMGVWYLPMEYYFDYRYKRETVNVNGCFGGWEGVPHTRILDLAITELKKKIGNNFKPSEYYCGEISSVRDSYVQCRNFYERYDIKHNQVIEIVSKGGFNYHYYVIHNIDELDVKEIISRPKELFTSRSTVCNVAHLLDRLGKTPKEVNAWFRSKITEDTNL
jgi:hypothetical protein